MVTPILGDSDYCVMVTISIDPPSVRVHVKVRLCTYVHVQTCVLSKHKKSLAPHKSH